MIKQLIKNTRQPIKNLQNLPFFEDVLKGEEHVLGYICDSDHGTRTKAKKKN